MFESMSAFGRRFAGGAGILTLMDDLGAALAGDGEKLMLGGGNPSHIPEMESRFRASMQAVLESPDEFERLIGNYERPQGDLRFIRALCEMLNNKFGWRLQTSNIALTPGSQASFFYLFNLFAGIFPDGSHRQVLFPMAPEYIGYADLGLSDDMFVAHRPTIEKLEDGLFKYRVDFSGLTVSSTLGAVCVSRPTNPTGNVVTDAEMQALRELARIHKVPLIIDSAYGAPFPNILFERVEPVWDENIVLCMSLSKLGLPGVRTGIIVAREDIIRAVSSVNAIVTLANGNLGPVLMRPLVESGELLTLCDSVIKPWYQTRVEQTLEWLRSALTGINYYVHKPEGAIFLWLWFPGLPISSQALYERLKDRGVVVVSGHHFFPGFREPWEHTNECLRVTYSQSPEVVRRGVAIIAEEVRQAYSNGMYSHTSIA